MKTTRLILLLLLSLAIVGATAAERGLQIRDLVMMERVGGPRLSPDGATVAFLVRETDLEQDKGLYSIWLVPTRGGAARRLTEAGASNSNPHWSPDGETIFFSSDRTESTQIWRQSVAESTAHQVTDYPLDVGSFQLAPDGRSLALTFEVFADCGADLACTAERTAEAEATPASGVLYDQLFIRHWDTWKNGTRSQLFVATLDEHEHADEPPVHVSKGITGDIPSKPFGDAAEYTFAPDSRSLVFAARTDDRGEPWSTNFDLFSVPADGSQAPRNLTTANKAMDSYPVFSPDGKTLYYLAMKRPGFESDRLALTAMTMADGAVREINPGWDRSATAPVLSADGRELYTTADDNGDRALFAVNIKTGKTHRAIGDGRVGGISVGADVLVIGHGSFQSPTELFRVDRGGKLTQLTSFNQERLVDVVLGESESFEFAGWNDERVQGFVIKPYNYRKGEKYPVAFLIHGGPQGQWTNDFHYRWNAQTFSGQGFAAVIVNFHGSTGSGQAFTDSITGDWGGKPLVDLQKGLAAALAKYPWLDGDRVCALGPSYGGFMINWIAGQWPEAFRCLVNHDGLFDMRSMAYSTEEMWFMNVEFGGSQTEVPENYEKFSPVNHVADWKVPMLVIHGANDHRVPLEQGIGAFTALQSRGIDSQFLYFPDENHWVLKPGNQIQWHDTVNAWLRRWLLDD